MSYMAIMEHASPNHGSWRMNTMVEGFLTHTLLVLTIQCKNHTDQCRPLYLTNNDKMRDISPFKAG